MAPLGLPFPVLRTRAAVARRYGRAGCRPGEPFRVVVRRVPPPGMAYGAVSLRYRSGRGTLPSMLDLSPIGLLAFDLDGTLTDGTTWWGGGEVGWLQRYSVRDGEAILRLKSRLFMVPLSANKTRSASERCQLLGLETTWLGVDDKMVALGEIMRRFEVSREQVGFVGDGAGDAEVLRAVGVGMAVADAHPRAQAAADFVLRTAGGDRVMEEIELRFLETSA